MSLGLSQMAYIEKVLERFRMKDCASSVALIVKADKFSCKQCPLNELKRQYLASMPYDSIVDNLMYAQVYTRPDIAFAASIR